MALVETLNLLLPDRLTPLSEREEEIVMHAIASERGRCLAAVAAFSQQANAGNYDLLFEKLADAIRAAP
jgi:hypothetical protein